MYQANEVSPQRFRTKSNTAHNRRNLHENTPPKLILEVGVRGSVEDNQHILTWLQVPWYFDWMMLSSSASSPNLSLCMVEGKEPEGGSWCLGTMDGVWRGCFRNQSDDAVVPRLDLEPTKLLVLSQPSVMTCYSLQDHSKTRHSKSSSHPFHSCVLG
jgi:hypothetical protein